MKSSEQHAACGAECPKCRGRDINSLGGLEQDTREAWQHMECFNCGGMWTDHYALTGFSNFEHAPQ